MNESFLLLFLLMMTIMLGIELIYKIPSILHTPLMSGTNAVSGITLIGAFASAGSEYSTLTTVLGCLAVIFATINVVGGFLVTDRMLNMFRSGKKDPDKEKS